MISSSPNTPRDRLLQFFPLAFVIFVSGLIFFGFSHTVTRELIHPQKTPPVLLYVHAALASIWLLFLVMQTGLIANRSLQLHRTLGLAGAGLGAAVSIVAFFTAIELRKLDLEQDPVGGLAYLAIPLGAWITFSTPFALAILWRKQPRRHRPLMMIAACAMAGPAIARIPGVREAGLYWTALIPDGLIAAAMIHDRLRYQAWNSIYFLGLGLMVVAQGLAVYLALGRPAFWLAAARSLLGWF